MVLPLLRRVGAVEDRRGGLQIGHQPLRSAPAQEGARGAAEDSDAERSSAGPERRD